MVLVAPEVGARSAWMRNALLVMVLAGEPGAEHAVPGSSLEPPTRMSCALPRVRDP